MRKPLSILVVVDRGKGIAGYLGKAIGVARHYGASLELFLCEAEQAYLLARQYDREGVESARAACVSAARAYLGELKASVDIPDVEISIAAQCESPLYVGIVHEVLRKRSDLVIKRAAAVDGGSHGSADPNDWQLMCTCPATLMLTRGRSWNVPPRFAAAVDVSKGEMAGLAENVLEAARILADGWRAQLDVIYSEAAGVSPVRAHLDELHRLCDARRIPSERTHVLHGDPETTLPAFTAQRDYDVLILGALAHRPAGAAQPGALTSMLVEALDCDFVLVKPSGYRSPVGGR